MGNFAWPLDLKHIPAASSFLNPTLPRKLSMPISAAIMQQEVAKVDDGGGIEGEFVRILHTASEYSGSEAVKAPGSIACYERKGRVPIWVVGKNLQTMVRG